MAQKNMAEKGFGGVRQIESDLDSASRSALAAVNNHISVASHGLSLVGEGA
jgi:hypothetical protein